MKAVTAISTLCAMLCIGDVSRASTSDCQNLYIGRIWVEKGYGLYGVVFLNNATDAYGSYWVYFNTWNLDDRKSALTLLTTAKIMQHRVNVATEESDGCGINTGWRQAKSVFLANTP